MHLHNLLCLRFGVRPRILSFLYLDCHLLVDDSDAAPWRTRLSLVVKGVCLHIGLVDTIYILLAVVLQDLLNYCGSFFVTRNMGLLS